MELLAVVIRPVPDALVDFWEPISHTGLPYQALIKGEKLSPITT